MVVTIAGWIYIIQGALGLWSLTVGPYGWRMSLVNLVTMLVSVLSGFIGYGLLKRDPRARWWALGSSLISWVVGGLVFLVGIAVVIYFSSTSRGSGAGSLLGSLFSGGGFVALLFGLMSAGLYIAIVVVMYKLFWYLCSRDGCEEFGVGYGSARTVLASAGAWIALTFTQVWVASIGISGMGIQQVTSRTQSEQRVAAQDVAREAARQETRAAIEREEERQRAALLEEAQQALAQSQENERLRGDAPDANYDPPPQDSPPAQESADEESEAPVPVFGSADAGSDTADDEKKPNKILKCRDKSGAVSYTQGYCPPGTTLVDSPGFE